MRITRTVEIKQPPRAVWARLEDFDSWAKWAEPLGKPRRITAGRWTLGWRGKLGGTVYEITDLMDTAPNYQMIWFGSQFGTTSVWTFLVEPVRGRTETTIIIEQNGWVASLLGRWRQKGHTARLAAALDGFRKFAEGTPAVPRVNQQPVSSADA
jgi:hypothetical protein